MTRKLEENPWRREAHYARALYALDIIDITPSVVERQPPLPERRVNRRVQAPELIAHQVTRQIAMDARMDRKREREALEAANAALHPLERSWWTRAARWLRGVFGRA